MSLRTARVNTDDTTKVAAYLPHRYHVIDSWDGHTYIQGEDFHGWTLEDYVIPRLASGGMHCAEVRITAELGCEEVA